MSLAPFINKKNGPHPSHQGERAGRRYMVTAKPVGIVAVDLQQT